MSFYRSNTKSLENNDCRTEIVFLKNIIVEIYILLIKFKNLIFCILIDRKALVTYYTKDLYYTKFLDSEIHYFICYVEMKSHEK